MAKKKDNWMQSVEKGMDEKGTVGAFTKQAKRAKMTPVDFAKHVLANPSKFRMKTRQRAQFVKNANPELFATGGGVGDVNYRLDGTVWITDTDGNEEMLEISNDSIIASSEDEAIEKWKAISLAEDDVESVEADLTAIPRSEYSKGGGVGSYDEKMMKFLEYSHIEISEFLKRTLGSKLDENWEFTVDGTKYEVEPAAIIFDKADDNRLQEATFNILKGEKEVGEIEYLQDEELNRFRAKSPELEFVEYHFEQGGETGETSCASSCQKYGAGGFIFGSIFGGYVGYKIGRARPQKRGFSTEKKVAKEAAKNIKAASKKVKESRARRKARKKVQTMATGGGVKGRSKRKGDIGNRDKKVNVDTITSDRVIEVIYYDKKGAVKKEETVSIERGLSMIEGYSNGDYKHEDNSRNGKISHTFINPISKNREVSFTETHLYSQGGEIGVGDYVSFKKRGGDREGLIVDDLGDGNWEIHSFKPLSQSMVSKEDVIGRAERKKRAWGIFAEGGTVGIGDTVLFRYDSNNDRVGTIQSETADGNHWVIFSGKGFGMRTTMIPKGDVIQAVELPKKTRRFFMEGGQMDAWTEVVRQYQAGTLKDEDGNIVTDKEKAYQMAHVADRKSNPARYAFKDGGGVGKSKLNSVEVIFTNPDYNYTTSVASAITEDDARKYFVGKSFNVASFPKEQFEEVIDIKYHKGTLDYGKGGGVNCDHCGSCPQCNDGWGIDLNW